MSVIRAGDYALAMSERLPYADSSFDLVVSYVSLVDTPDYRGAIAEAARVLRPGGRFLIANLGFVSASPELGWARDEQGNRLYQRIDNYAGEHPHVLSWAGISILNWHRPLSYYMTALLESGLQLRASAGGRLPAKRPTVRGLVQGAAVQRDAVAEA